MIPDLLPHAADAGHLTEVLRQAGVLAQGRVSAVSVETSRPTILSHILRLRLTCEGAGAEAPKTLILKTARPDLPEGLWNAGMQEVAFYRQVAPALSAGIVPRCFEACWDADTKAWHLLLEDLTDSHHIATTWPQPPSLEQCRGILRARARFHAAWWDDPRLGVSVGTWQDAAAMEAIGQTFAEHYARFADRLGDLLSAERRALYVRLLEAAPDLRQRYLAHRNLTILHGDAHVWNCFLPRQEGSEDVRLFDWDSWHIGVAADDLAYMMALHWYPDFRRRFERPLLDHYHEALVANGVQGYGRRALEDDYRMSVLWQITTPVWQAAHDIPTVIWWNNLERIFLAVEDLECGELLA